MLRIAIGIVCGIVLVGVIAVVVMWSGAYPIAAAESEYPLDPVFAWASDRAIDQSAEHVEVPADVGEGGSIEHGLEHYAQMCVMCHGAPGVEAGTAFLMHGLNPRPPAMLSEKVQGHSDRALFWVIKNGIRATGMPAFGSVENDDAIWELVRVVRAMPELSESQRNVLEQHAPRIGHQEAGGEEAPNQPPKANKPEPHEEGDHDGSAGDHSH